MKFRRRCFFWVVILFVVFLAGCASNGKQWNPDDYTVKSGDTIYAIAWRYELDPEDFAAWNGIAPSSFIKPGQRLHTRKPDNFKPSVSRAHVHDIAYAPRQQAVPLAATQASRPSKNLVTIPVNQPWVKASRGDTLYGISKRSGVSVERLAQLNQLKKPYTIKPGQTIFLKPLKTAARSSAVPESGNKASNKTTKKTVVPAKTKPQQAASQSFRWPRTVQWQKPAKGKIIKKFSRQRNDSKGIDIAGKQGDAIVASAAGKVVYSGNGLISYGNLIIIKHNKTYLSAYAYNRKLLVKEGDQVKSGQKIAEMGRKDKLSPRLHFEIRKNGKPVDPLKYLPW